MYSQSADGEHWRPQAVIPMVIESSYRGERVFDIYSRLLRERIIMIGTPIDELVVGSVIAQLLFLASDDPAGDIWLYLNSPGGSVTSGLALYDTIQLIQPDVATVCMGSTHGMASVLLAGGARGKRYILPNSRVHMHPAPGGASGYAPDVEVQARELLRQQQMVREILAADTGQSMERINKDFDRDLFLTAQQAREYGIVDSIMAGSDESWLARGALVDA